MRVARVPKRQIQRSIAREIDAAIGARGIQQKGEAASLLGRTLGELAGVVKLGLIYPLTLRAIAGLHQKIGCVCSCAIEYQAALREKAMRNNGKKRQQDADQQGS